MVKSGDSVSKDVIEIPVGKYLDKMRRNPWMVSTVVLAILLIVFFLTFSFSDKGIGSSKAGDNLVKFINSQGNGEAKFVSGQEESGLYKLLVDFSGSQVPIYVTLDGKYAVSDLIPLDSSGKSDNEPKVVNVEEGNGPSEGSEDAKVVIVEFSDYECPFCGKFYSESYLKIKKDYIETGKVRLVFRDFPLEFHPNAKKAAEAARCVRDQIGDRGYFMMHDKLFENQQSLSEDTYKKLALSVGVDPKKFETCLTSGKFSSAVEDDSSYGRQLGVSGTPSFFINGRSVVGAVPYSEIKKVIDEELAK